MFSFDTKKYKTELRQILEELQDLVSQKELDGDILRTVLKKYPRDNKGLFSKDQLLKGYKLLIKKKELKPSEKLKDFLTTKPTRTISGVAPVTVLTKPYTCPGTCIYCPDVSSMPKSYIPSEPGAQRALLNKFDPYTQVYNRLLALNRIGHAIDKIELIVIGGTWSVYPENYQIWFIEQLFRALNEFKKTEEFIKPKESKQVELQSNSTCQTLETQHLINVSSLCRCVGLSLETRPDCVDEEEIERMRHLGATKVQIGVQNLDDSVLDANKRGHTTNEIYKAFKLLRKAGFKIQAHWMPNLYKSSVECDKKGYKKLWNSKLHPDEIKIYPTSVIKQTELYDLYESGEYKPYTITQLKDVIKTAMLDTPRYCRITRVIRDIPEQEIEAGSKITNLRQIIHKEMKKDGVRCECIRCREIRGGKFSRAKLNKELIKYETQVGTDYFLSFITPSDKIVGFLRLSVPDVKLRKKHFIEELADTAIIREIHVYGEAAVIGESDDATPQHMGLGKKLIDWAEQITVKNDLSKISVISAVGTRQYYKKRGFKRGSLYMHKKLS
jgi:elongator complex protein 3